MFWTDRQYVIGISDLIAVESEIPNVVDVEQLNLNNIQAQTQSECWDKIRSMVQRFGTYLSNGQVTADHNAAVWLGVGSSGVRTNLRQGNIVVQDFERHPIQNWITYCTLVNLYQTAASRASGLADRYKEKFRHYDGRLKERIFPIFLDTGIPVVWAPLPCPGAVGERGAGTFGSGNVSAVTAAGAIGGTFDVSITWVAQTVYTNPAVKGNGESAPSITLTTTVASGHALSLNISGLTAPTATVSPWDQGQTTLPNQAATAWNVYVGQQGQPQYLQNVAPIPLATTAYNLSTDPVQSGYVTDLGQYVQEFARTNTRRRRG